MIRKISTQEGLQLANEIGVPFVECSAKEGKNISTIFSLLLEQIEKESTVLNQSKKCSVMWVV